MSARVFLLAVSYVSWCVAACPALRAAEVIAINDRRIHLRNGENAEWDTFANSKPDAARLDLVFGAHSNVTAATLFIRQDDVRQDWGVEVNGRKLGKLFTMEADLVHTLNVPPGLLQEGSNHLSILPPQTLDDIVIHEIALDSRPQGAATIESSLRIRVRAKEGKGGLPCRITVVDRNGALAALAAITNTPNSDGGIRSAARSPSLLAIRPGVAYTGDGVAAIGLKAGAYTIYASRGFEWSVATQKVSVAAGEARTVDLELGHEVDTRGWVSCDTHVHTFTYSRHGDSSLVERMLTLAGEGIELPVATDHNLHVDYTEAALTTRTDPYFTPITGNEVTTPAGHFNIFPVRTNAAPPDFNTTDWPSLMTAMRATPDVRVVILNHPRNVHTGFQPFAATNFNTVSGDNLRGPEFTFDAMEVMNSSAQQSDYLLVYRDWFALLNHGYRVTTVGSSDCHDVSRYIVGQGRTYIAANDAEPGRIDIAAACSNLVAGRALVSMGLLTQIRVDDRFGPGDLDTALGAELRIVVNVLGPSWITATNIALYANGSLLLEEKFTPSAGAGLKQVVRWRVPRPKHDLYLVAIATGPGVTAPFWAIPKPYQPVSRSWTGRVIGSSNPVWVDGDNDGRFTPARSYARAALQKAGTDASALVRELARFDEATAAQAASLCANAGIPLDSPVLGAALKSASPAIQRGFAQFTATQISH